MKAIIPFLALVLTSCASHQSDPELAMEPEMAIHATTSQGTMTVRYVDTLTREYEWGGNKKRFKHKPRNERWYGSLGIYRPTGDSSMHAVLEEGQQHFQSLEEAQAWIKKKQNFCEYVWNKNGLVVGWKEQKRPGDGFVALHVDVWQIYISESKPTEFPVEKSNAKLKITMKK